MNLRLLLLLIVALTLSLPSQAVDGS